MSLEETFPERRKQIDTLRRLLLNGSPPNSVFVYGHTATGKTEVVKGLLQGQQRVAWINCIDALSTRTVFESILNQLNGHISSPDNEFRPWVRCENINDFVRHLKTTCDHNTLSTTHNDGDRAPMDERDDRQPTTPVFLVFDRANRLRDSRFPATLLAVILRLRELTQQCNIASIFISDIVWDKFGKATGSTDPVLVHFPSYSEEEIKAIVVRTECPASEEPLFFAHYTQLLLDVFNVACNDLNELRYLAALLFPRYIAPVLAGKCDRSDPRALYVHVSPILRSILPRIYLREVSAADLDSQILITQQQQPQKDKSSTATETEAIEEDGEEGEEEEEEDTTHLKTSVSLTKTELELPFYAKYLLIAAFLASYNPAKSDVQVFTVNANVSSSGKKSRAKQKKDQIDPKKMGPATFPLDRLLAIFYSLLNDKVQTSSDIYVQISNLVSLQLLTRTSAHTGQLDGVRFRCNAPYERVLPVARSVAIDLPKYLYDSN